MCVDCRIEYFSEREFWWFFWRSGWGLRFQKGIPGGSYSTCYGVLYDRTEDNNYRLRVLRRLTLLRQTATRQQLLIIHVDVIPADHNLQAARNLF